MRYSGWRGLTCLWVRLSVWHYRCAHGHRRTRGLFLPVFALFLPVFWSVLSRCCCSVYESSGICRDVGNTIDCPRSCIYSVGRQTHFWCFGSYIPGGLLFGKTLTLFLLYRDCIACGACLQCTVYGRRMYAVGGNAEAARYQVLMWIHSNVGFRYLA